MAYVISISTDMILNVCWDNVVIIVPLEALWPQNIQADAQTQQQYSQTEFCQITLSALQTYWSQTGFAKDSKLEDMEAKVNLVSLLAEDPSVEFHLRKTWRC